MTSTRSSAINRLEYPTWFSPPSGFPESPYPRRSARTTVKCFARVGATLCQHATVCGCPCNSRSAGPWPPTHVLMVVPLVVIVDCLNPGNSFLAVPLARPALLKMDGLLVPWKSPFARGGRVVKQGWPHRAAPWSVPPRLSTTAGRAQWREANASISALWLSEAPIMSRPCRTSKRWSHSRPLSSPALSMPCRNCLGMIWSVSRLAISSGAAMPSIRCTASVMRRFLSGERARRPCGERR